MSDVRNFLTMVFVPDRKIPRCKICGATKILFIDGTWVCDSCEVGGVKSGLIKTGADIANDITCYEAMHEPSLKTKEYGISLLVHHL